MIPLTELEEQLLILIERYRALQKQNAALRLELEEQDNRAKELETRCASLEEQLDALGKQRFTVKRLEEERQVMKRQLDTALERLSKIEQEL